MTHFHFRLTNFHVNQQKSLQSCSPRTDNPLHITIRLLQMVISNRIRRITTFIFHSATPLQPTQHPFEMANILIYTLRLELYWGVVQEEYVLTFICSPGLCLL